MIIQEVVLKWPKDKQNLIVVFVESLESSYANKSTGGFYEENFIPHLTEMALSPNYTHFSDKEPGKIGGTQETISAAWNTAGVFTFPGGLIPTTSEEAGHNVSLFAAPPNLFKYMEAFNVHSSKMIIHYMNLLNIN